MKSKLIALDIDGTILDRYVGLSVPPAVKEAVRDARKAGARVCLCSSRPRFIMEDAFSGLEEIDALISYSGAMIELLADRRQLFAGALPRLLSLACFEIAKELDFYLSYAGEEKIFVCKRGPKAPPVADDPLFAIMDEDALLDMLNRDAELLFSSFIFTKPGMLDETVTTKPGLAEASICKTGGSCLIITDKGTDKGTAVLRLAAHWDIPREAILAVGNDENDIPMLRVAGVGVAVANASPEALAAADWIAPGVASAGAAEAIRRYAL